MKTLIAVLLAIAGLYVGCTEFQEGDTIITLTGATAPTVETTGRRVPVAPGTIELDPLNFTVSVGKNVNVTVTVRDTEGEEVDTENLTVDIVDESIVSLVEKTDRTLAFEGKVVGATPIIIGANGLQTATTGTVIP